METNEACLEDVKVKTMSKAEYKQALPAGHRIDDYRLLKVLGVGGFGVTYLAEDVKLGSKVAIKEYLPNEFAVRDGTTVHPKSDEDQEDFGWGLKRFLDEARTLAKFHHRNLVRVLRYFEANSTAYFVMEYEEGESLEHLLSRRKTLTGQQLRGLLLPLLDGLKSVHTEGFLHRDIKPSNVFVRREDESPVLLDFGAARNALGRKSRSMTAVVTPGYSPPEQYESDGEQGPWTDIYALAALCARAVTGKRPEESPRRWRMLFRDGQDPLRSLEAVGVPGYSKQFLAAVDWGLKIDDRERPKNVDEWLAAMSAAEVEGATAEVAEPEAPSKQSQQASAAQSQDTKPSHDASKGTDKAGGRASGIFGSFDVWAWLAQRKLPALLGLTVLAALSLAVLGARLAFQEPTGQTPSTVGDDGGGAVQPVQDDGIPPPLSFRIANDSVQVISSVFVASNHAEGWGASRLAGGLGVEAGGESVVELQDHGGLCQYDVLVTSEAGLEQQFDDADLCGDDGLVFAGGQVFTVANESEQTIHSVFAFTDQQDERGEDRLPQGLLIGVGNEFPVQIDGYGERCLFSVLVVAGGGLEAEYPSLDLCAAERVVFAAKEPEPPLLASFTVQTEPSDARVRILNIGPPYEAGMLLPPGEYRVEVSAAGYEPKTDAVPHGSSPTMHQVALEKGRPAVGDRFRDCPECPEMVVVPAGRFAMGSRREAGRGRDEGPVRSVTISEPFAIGAAEVTFAEWDACVAAGGCDGYRPSDEGWGRGMRPVINVSWLDADQYISWLSQRTSRKYRLPSEAEWEYAARAQTTTARYWGDSDAEQCRYANGADRSAGGEYPDWTVVSCADGHVHTAPVDGGFTPNGWGLAHTLGNVWEWTADCRNDNYVGAPSDGSAWTSNCSGELILRGGSWSNQSKRLRSAQRFYRSMDHRNRGLGFRVVRVLDQ